MNNLPYNIKKAVKKYGYDDADYKGRIFGCHVYEMYNFPVSSLLGRPHYLVVKFGIIHKASFLLNSLIMQEVIKRASQQAD